MSPQDFATQMPETMRAIDFMAAFAVYGIVGTLVLSTIVQILQTEDGDADDDSESESGG